MSYLETDDLHKIAGDAVPGEAVRVRQGGRAFNVTTATISDDGSVTIYAEQNPDETRDETTSAAPMVAEDGNASEAGSQPGGTTSARAAVPLHGHRDEDARQHLRNVGAQRDVEKARADAAEAKLAEIRHLLAPFWLYACQVHHYEDALQKIRKIVKSEHPEAGR